MSQIELSNLLRGIIIIIISYLKPYTCVQVIHNKLEYLINSLSWVWFYGISWTVDYLMPNPVHTYISDIYDL